MRPVVVTAVLLLVVLMSMSASAAWNPGEMCRTTYPVDNCRKDVGPGCWFQFGPNRCVKAFHNKYLTHKEAKDACRAYPNGDLVSIHSLVELCQVECAMYRAATTNYRYWIGLWRSSKGLVWTDGTKHDYSYWARGQPSNDWGREGCVEMNYKDWGRWNDDVCTSWKSYVCQVKL